MCGIFASISSHPIAQNAIELAFERLHHRGPDGRGLWRSNDGCRLLGHTRLSIIGIDNGAQPISDESGSVQIVVNGEFYGYQRLRETLRCDGCRFRTDSDSEIALHLYVKRGLQNTAKSLRGEFAVIIADEHSQSLVAIRDRFGIKPLYYAQHKGDVFFASEIKALLALGVPARWDFDAAAGGSNQSHEITHFANIRAVPPGCYVIARQGDLRTYPYWDWDMPPAEELAQDSRDESEIVAEFASALENAVQERLVADVPVGCYLSGGIDSCAVLGFAQKSSPQPIQAFTLSFDNPLYDETELARRQAEFSGAAFHPVPVTGRDLADAYADAVWHAETPMFNGHGVAKFLLSRAVHAAGIKCVLTGEGADELFGGYPAFRVDAIAHDPGLAGLQKQKMLNEMFAQNEAMRAIMMPKNVEDPDLEGVQDRLGWLSSYFTIFASMTHPLFATFSSQMQEHAKSVRPSSDALDRLPLAQRVAGRDRLNQILYIMSKTNLPNLVLTYLGDRMEMAHSVEGRVPFLDHIVAEDAARVPVGLKIKGLREKHLLREAAAPYLIPEVYNRQKHPFSTPPVASKKDPMMQFYRDTFAGEAARVQPIFDLARIQKTLGALLDAPSDKRIAAEAVLQRAASVVVMQERFRLT